MPQIKFTGIQFQGEPEKKEMLDPDRIDVQGGKRNFAITFAALDYSDNSNIQYAYKLADDPDWTYIGTAHTAHFNHLAPGDHTLLVKSTDCNGVWLDNQREIAITVHPDFWESNWAKVIYLALFVLVAWLVAYLFTLNRKSSMTNMLRKKEKQFFINASHQLRTPLTLIGGPVAEVLETEPLSDRARGYLEKVHRNSQEMLDMVNGILTSASDHNYITDDRIPEVQTPAAEAAVAPPLPVSSAVPVAATAPRPPRSGEPRVKILVVEDNDDLRSFLCDILAVQYDVVSAPNGAVGLEKAEKEQPDFIITDVTMPEMDGLTMVQKIKQNKKLSHIPIIVLSARASVEDRVRGLSEGVDDYITKPFSATYLRQRISSI
ncbi:MAG: response regulator, partial [Muribaculaceae bacterium]|nr:response regulator [Muribaculaceae bacterium]